MTDLISLDLSKFHPAWVAAPTALAAASVLVPGWRRTMRERDEKRKDRQLFAAAIAARPPESAVRICTEGAPQAYRDRSGRIMLVLIGDFGTNEGEDILWSYQRSGMEGAIGSVLALQGDRRRRQQFLERVPPIFRDRIVPVEFPALGGGFGNRTPSEVNGIINRWGWRAVQAARQVCEHHEARTNDEAALVLVFLGFGGSAQAGMRALQEIKRLHRLANCYGFAALPVDDVLAMEAQGIFAGFFKAGVLGFVVSHNLQDEVLNDFGMDAAVVGFTTAALHSDASVEPNNGWRLLFGRAPGGLASYHTYVRTLPGHRVIPTHPLVPPQYSVDTGLLSSALNDALEEVHNDEYFALPGGAGLNGRVPLTSEFDIFVVPVTPHDLKPIEDEIVEGQRLMGRDKRNYHLLVAPLAAVVNPDRIHCPIALVSLRALHDPKATLRALTTPVGKAALSKATRKRTEGGAKGTRPRLVSLPGGERKQIG